MNSENIMTDLEAIQNDLYPKTTLEGSHITAENTVEGLRGVVSADEETEVTVCNKNLFNYLDKINKNYRGLTTSVDKETGYITVNGTPTTNYSNLVSKYDITDILEDGETYTLWQEVRDSDIPLSGVYVQITRTSLDGTVDHITASANNQAITIDKSNYTYVINALTGPTDNTGTLEDYKNRYMLYKGTEESEYVLPKSKAYTVSDKTEIRTYDDITHIYNTDDVNMTAEVRVKEE